MLCTECWEDEASEPHITACDLISLIKQRAGVTESVVRTR